MVKISEAISECVGILTECTDDARLEASVLAGFVLGMDRLQLMLHGSDVINAERYSELIACVKRRAAGEPVAYITGQREFMSLNFCVNKNVLIPRPDTEILVEAVIEKYHDRSVNILDLCTGSGAIACSLAYYIKNSRISGVDISEEAIDIAKNNAQKLGVGAKTHFFRHDVLTSLEDCGRFDAVVSNPPYIETEAINALSRDVKDYEPLIALDGGAGGLLFYEKITENIESCLKKGGELYFEIGYNQAEAVHDIMVKKFCEITVLKDLAGHDRVVYGQLV